MNRRQFLAFAIPRGVAALVASYPVFIEPHFIQVNRYQIPIAELPRSFHGFTLAHLTDLHYGLLVSESFLEHIVHRTNRLRTDIIVCTGDYVNRRNATDEIDKVWPILSKLRARHGVYSVLGNHDHWADLDRSVYWLQRSGQDLRHKSKVISKGKDHIFIAGAGDLWTDYLGIDQAFSRSDENACKLLLAHNPDSIDQAFDTPVSLVLSGHTHGGQVVLPVFGPPVLPVHNKNYSSGLITAARTQLFISRGIGWSMLPIRFNCIPEIAVLELVRPDRIT